MGSKLATRARQARIRAGFARESDAAKVIGCSRPTVIRWETDADSIGGKYLLAAARAYKVRPEWLSLETDHDGYPWSPAHTPEHGKNLTLQPQNETKGPSDASHFLRPDPIIVRQANMFLTIKFAEANVDDLLFDLDKHAELFSLAYSWLSNRSDRAGLAELTRAVNEVLERGRNEHGDRSSGGVRQGKRASGTSA